MCVEVLTSSEYAVRRALIIRFMTEREREREGGRERERERARVCACACMCAYVCVHVCVYMCYGMHCVCVDVSVCRNSHLL